MTRHASHAARLRLVLGALFFLSGAAALGVETTWLRWFRTLFGATAPAASATLVAFLTGHAAGAALAARFLPRVRRPLRVYGLLELAAAACALLVPPVLALGGDWLSAAYPALGESGFALTGLRFALAVTATFPAAACFGATLPVLGAAVIGSPAALGRMGAAFYGINTAGAALGAALASFLLPELLGVSGGYAAAAALSVVAGLGALGIAALSRAAEAVAPPAKTRASVSPLPRALPGPLALAALSGLVAFAAQVLFVQAFAQVLNGSVYAFGCVLIVVLVALALGAALVAALERRTPLSPRTLLAFALGAAGLALAGFPQLLLRSTDGLRYVGSESPFPGYLGAALGTVALSAGPALLALSLLFPLSFTLAARSLGEGSADSTLDGVGSVLGRLTAVNTAGAIAGAITAPYLLLPTLGLWPSFAVLGGILAVASLAVRPEARDAALARDALLGLGWVAVMSAASPLGVPPVRLESGEALLFRHDDAAGVVAVVGRSGERLIRTDNYSVLGGTSETVHQRRQGHLPLLLHPTAKRVAYVGSATGISAGATLGHPIEALRLVELVPGVAEAARRFFHDANRGVYDDPRTRIALDDARNFLRATPERYDLIVADLFVPWRAGTGSLYTREHFEAVREHLAQDGVFSQWLPLYQLTEEELRIIIATFLDVFPRAALFRGDFYGGYPIVALVGWKGAVASPSAMAEAASRLAAGGEADRWLTDPAGIWSLYVAPLAPFAAELATTPRNEDEHPEIEFRSARSHAGGASGKQSPLVGVGFARFAARLAAAAGAGDDVYPGLSEDQRRAMQGGAALQAAGAFYVERRGDEAARSFERAASLLPPRLVRDADADPTAAEVWGDVR
jgi:spermidine synthase